MTTDEVAAEYPSYLTLDRSTFTLRLWKDLKLAKTYTVAVGAGGLETPEGLYSIQDKAGKPGLERARLRLGRRPRRADDPAGAREPDQGALDGDLRRRRHPRHRRPRSLGSAASHGCVRMAIPDVKSSTTRSKSARRSTSAETARRCAVAWRRRRPSGESDPCPRMRHLPRSWS